MIMKQKPFIYALTSEVDKYALDTFIGVGFKAIFGMLTIDSVKQILDDAGLGYRPVVDTNEVVMFDPSQNLDIGAVNGVGQGDISDSDSGNGRLSSNDDIANEIRSDKMVQLESIDQDKASI